MEKSQKDKFEEWFFAEVDGGSITESIAWQAWQAAIGSVVVDLGHPSNFDGTESGDFYWRSVVEKALDKAGVSYE